MDRRALFFLGAALVCFALAPIGLTEHRHLAIIVGCVYVVLAGASAVDARNHERRRGQRRR